MPSVEKEIKEKHAYLQSVTNCLRILKSFTDEKSEWTVKELSATLGISSSAVSRLLSTMANEGFITKISGTHRFRLGNSVLALSGVLTSSQEIYREALPVLEQLVKKTGETSHLSILENYHTVYLHKVDSNHPVQTLSYIGKPNPLHCTSSGKGLTAFSEDAFIQAVVERGLERHTPKTLTDPDVFLAQLQQIRRQKYAIDVEEFLTGVSSIAAPIRDYTKKVVAAVNVVGPIQRVNQNTIPFLVSQVVEAANEISQRMGYFSKP